MSRLKNIPNPVLLKLAAGLKRMKDRRPKSKLNWRAYYLNFQEAHGEPVVWGGTLLFRDGWRYSATDHAGPEYPPPKNHQQLRELQIAYWDTKRKQLRELHHQLAVRANGLRSYQDAKSLPLMETTIYPSDDGKLSSNTAEVDLEFLEQDRDDAKALLDECIAELEKLREPIHAS